MNNDNDTLFLRNKEKHYEYIRMMIMGDNTKEISELVKDAALLEEHEEFLRQLRERRRTECIEEALAHREIDEGEVTLTVMPLLFGRARLTVGNNWTDYEYFYDFDCHKTAINQMKAWRPDVEPKFWTRKTTKNGTQYIDVKDKPS
jgi:hypothetical protein